MGDPWTKMEEEAKREAPETPEAREKRRAEDRGVRQRALHEAALVAMESYYEMLALERPTKGIERRQKLFDLKRLGRVIENWMNAAPLPEEPGVEDFMGDGGEDDGDLAYPPPHRLRIGGGDNMMNDVGTIARHQVGALQAQTEALREVTAALGGGGDGKVAAAKELDTLFSALAQARALGGAGDGGTRAWMRISQLEERIDVLLGKINDRTIPPTAPAGDPK